MDKPSRYRKRPVEIEALRWTGSNEEAMHIFAGANFNVLTLPCEEDGDATAQVLDALHSTWVLLYTGDWIIKGLRSEFYPCRHDVFIESYEPTE